MDIIKFSHQKREFNDTCLTVETHETDLYFYKDCPFGQMRLWKKSGRITVSNRAIKELSSKDLMAFDMQDAMGNYI